MNKQEIAMFKQGWVSTDMAAKRLGVHKVTVRRLIASGKIPSRDTCTFGRVGFIRITALAEAHEPGVREALKLDDWSDLEAES